MTLIASHRGGTHLWPENSRLAFRQTAAMEVQMVEFDVHQTRDNVLVVHHDSTIDRMTNGKGPIGSYTYDELMDYVIIGAAGETIPTLAETIDIFKPSHVDLRLEIKTGPNFSAYAGMEDRIVTELLVQDMVSRTLVTSFQLERLDQFAAALERQGASRDQLNGLMWLCSPQAVAQCGWTGVIAALQSYGIKEIGLMAAAIDRDLVARMGEHGIIVHAWAAHTTEAARAMFALGVASFTTDRPDLAVRAMRA
jgi:glycerophosphoryl diester phosphodiesterase